MQTTQNPASWTLREASANLRARKISPVELTQACLARIDSFNPKTNAWITVMREQALAQAKALEKETPRGPLHGIPIGLKDNIDAAGVRTTAGSRTLSGNVATSDAEVTRRFACRRSHLCRQGQHAYLRVGSDFGGQLLRTRSESLEPGTDRRRIVGGIGGGRCDG